ncbi:hypothetical protein SAMN05421736_1215 [Evansella caseinilytica]|uniref:Flagellar Assembly Protein A N-terminal region domain-containing protein n=1 Tax=Evansella caseinilytica TaxID=1503961 RepID=A0A1H3UF73_9BACI|nr:FapA family protein [Evansella caseinilytica]SDZ61100.1 hypothetical protein SAMN05421736_1215 [Evansella caseinilytica]
MSANKKALSDIISGLKINNDYRIDMYTDSEETEVFEDDLQEDDGFVEVRNHQIFVINPKATGKQPVLLPNPKVRVTINGSIVKKEHVVFEEDDIDWEMPPELEYKVTISKDNLHVYLCIFPEIFKSYHLKNKKRASRFVLEAEAIKRTLNLEEIVSEIVEEVYKKNVRVEINTTAILEELREPTFKEIIIAEGLPVIPSKDGYIKQYFSSTISEVLEEVKGTIDFKNRVKIPTVEAGDTIAHIVPPREGMPGHDVYGEALNPNRPKQIIARAKPRVKLAEDGNVIALVPGRPTLTGSAVKFFDVLEVYEVSSDVDMSTGNIFFNGDVVIRGNVKDNMRVECSGSLFVYGNVYHSVLTASQNIFVYGNVVQSKVNSGQFGLYYSDIYKLSQNLSLSLKTLFNALSQLKHALTSKNIDYKLGHIISTLVESKFSTIPEDVNAFFRINNEMTKSDYDLTLNFKILLNALRKFKDTRSMLTIESEQAIESIQIALRELIQKLESMILEESVITFNSASQSQIKTNGKITVKKEGIINTALFAGSEIIFEKNQSVIRGGKVDAVKKIKAGIVGTPRGKSPILYAGEEIEINELEHAHIMMQGHKITIDEKINKLTLTYSESEDRIVSNKRLPSSF